MKLLQPKHEQKLIYSGQLLNDSAMLKDVLRQYEGQETHTVHLVCASSRMTQIQQQQQPQVANQQPQVQTQRVRVRILKLFKGIIVLIYILFFDRLICRKFRNINCSQQQTIEYHLQ